MVEALLQKVYSNYNEKFTLYLLVYCNQRYIVIVLFRECTIKQVGTRRLPHASTFRAYCLSIILGTWEVCLRRVPYQMFFIETTTCFTKYMPCLIAEHFPCNKHLQRFVKREFIIRYARSYLLLLFDGRNFYCKHMSPLPISIKLSNYHFHFQMANNKQYLNMFRHECSNLMENGIVYFKRLKSYYYVVNVTMILLLLKVSISLRYLTNHMQAP